MGGLFTPPLFYSVRLIRAGNDLKPPMLKHFSNNSLPSKGLNLQSTKWGRECKLELEGGLPNLRRYAMS